MGWRWRWEGETGVVMRVAEGVAVGVLIIATPGPIEEGGPGAWCWRVPGPRQPRSRWRRRRHAPVYPQRIQQPRDHCAVERSLGLLCVNAVPELDHIVPLAIGSWRLAIGDWRLAIVNQIMNQMMDQMMHESDDVVADRTAAQRPGSGWLQKML